MVRAVWLQVAWSVRSEARCEWRVRHGVEKKREIGSSNKDMRRRVSIYGSKGVAGRGYLEGPVCAVTLLVAYLTGAPPLPSKLDEPKHVQWHLGTKTGYYQTARALITLSIGELALARELMNQIQSLKM